MSKSILLFAGEASGDYHAANLVKSLKAVQPDIRVTGIGGDLLKDAGMDLIHHYKEINTIALSEGLGKLKEIYAVYRRMKTELQSGAHDLFIPVDYPDVNIRLCKFAKASGTKVAYFISPQVWAWRKGRIKKIAARIDRMMTLFPFEEKLYKSAGVPANFIGHTMVRDAPVKADRGRLRRSFALDENKYLVALVPGSRPAEIFRLLPGMCEAARIHSAEFPETQFALPLAGGHLEEPVRDTLSKYEINVAIINGRASDVMAAADCGLVTSGTATLQAALAGMPHAIVYVLDKLTWWFAIRVLKPLVMDKDLHVGIANVLAIKAEGSPPINNLLEKGIRIDCLECGRPLFVPELLQDAATPENMAEWLKRFRTDTALVSGMRWGFDWIRSELSAVPGQTSVDIVLDLLNNGNVPPKK